MSTQKQKFQLFQKLQNLGFTYDESVSLRRIEMTLQRWGELECGTGDGQTTRSIERDGENGDGKPFMRIQYPAANGYHDSKYPVADREAGALLRLDKIISARNRREVTTLPRENHPAFVLAYTQGDCRGCNLYLLLASDIRPGESIDSIYTRGLAVCC